ncbi:hypothetical protein BBD42_12085 [Paenibacillus sp. BIHB 4019]|uniref:ABC transporter substrate-binding protein n=1 Tax=Paenibacillus sp. BIHB 4019 TaxID=1870819 RepID=A0A1B2DHG9_9BACL|nr:extracellular solute-binding protein [Paenibacillus sp. BIHB 4019]ANY67119.1 hypothetical protein BBD42_12085 [Paenibacillus sp. BIHB 4019]
MQQMGRKKRVNSFIVIGMMVSLLSACSGNSSSESPAANAGGQVTPSESTSSKEPVELSVFVNHPWFPVKDWSGSIPEMITEKTGVKLKVTVAADDKQLPLMIASGDLPDLVFTSTNLDRLADPAVSYSWNELIEKYAPDFKPDQDRIAINTETDGNFYTIRNNFATQAEWDANPNASVSPGALGIRQDIMDALGKPALNNLQDLENILGQVKAKYPDMIPLMLDKNWGYYYLKQQFGIPTITTDLYEKDGKVSYYINHPKSLDYYKYINSLYRNEYITGENFAFKDTLRDNDYVLKGKVFAEADNTNDIDNMNSQIKLDNNAKLTQLVKPLGSDAKYYNASVGWSGVYITKENKNPEASIKFMQYMFSEEGQKLGLWGIEGKHYKWNNEGKYPELLYKQGDSDYINKEGIGFWGLMSNSAAIDIADPNIESSHVKKAAKDTMVLVPALGLLVPKSDSEEGVILSKLKEMISTEEVRIFMSDSEESAVKAYNDMLAKAEQIGLSKYEAWLNKKYEEVKPLFQK